MIGKYIEGIAKDIITSKLEDIIFEATFTYSIDKFTKYEALLRLNHSTLGFHSIMLGEEIISEDSPWSYLLKQKYLELLKVLNEESV